MTQKPTQENPLYSCIIPISDVTRHQDEKIVAFGASADEARCKAEELLVDTYGCNETEVRKLLQQARVERLSPWCAPSDHQDHL